MAHISSPAIPMKMYRHFAIVTVMLTACLAMFADGENRQQADASAARAAEQHRGASQPRPAATPAYGQASLTRNDTGTFGGDQGSGFGQPTDRSAAMGSASSLPLANSENAGFTSAYLDSLSAQELQQLLDSLQSAGATSVAERNRILMVLEAASRRRSGNHDA